MIRIYVMWWKHKWRQLTVDIRTHIPFYHQKLPWGTLLCALVVNFVTPVYTKDKVDPSEYRHRGDLHLVRGSNVHSLAWVVELTDGCSVNDVIRDYKKKSHFMKYNICNVSDVILSHNQSKDYGISSNYDSDPVFSEKNHSVEQETQDIPTQLIVIKGLSLRNVYIIAHPYYWFYSREKRKWKMKRTRQVQRAHSSNTSSSVFHDYGKSMMDDVIFLRTEACLEQYFGNHPCVKYANQEVLRPRQKRRRVDFHDPLYEEQWHLKNSVAGQYDINVVGAWESGITGRGVTVCVIDDGLEWQHPDLRDNYSPAGSYDLNSDDPDPSPVKNGERNEHGTRCAGEIAAVTNNVCGVGVAYRANISGIRVLGGRMTDSMEAAAFIQGLEVNDIYSCSWGPDDDGKTVDGPHHLASRALVHGITYGRKGYGAIYVVASGNGGRNNDNCKFCKSFYKSFPSIVIE
ncbi:proprotein convertase subtilisin/kexin type 7-like [Homarus americanus]|uniref:proprotein convertase subtilisin/kexin type 7-like n=1 Tax=Homarus americanus TaxID=6706 RepID=UPI001C484F22|nr:proprotein convertase subtilisin/kexin type 7-like [Homarus americanus]